MTIDAKIIAELRDSITRKIVSDLELDAGVNIFYHLTKRESIESNPDQRFHTPRYSPGNEVGRNPETAREIGYRITNYGNWIKMEKKGELKPIVERVGLDLERVLFVRDWDKYSDGSYPTYSGGEITKITTAGRGGIIHTSPIEVSGFCDVTELTCGFVFYSLTDNQRLRRDEFIAVATMEIGNSFVGAISHRSAIRGSSNGLLRALSKAIGHWEKEYPFDKEAWELYNKLFQK